MIQKIYTTCTKTYEEQAAGKLLDPGLRCCEVSPGQAYIRFLAQDYTL